MRRPGESMSGVDFLDTLREQIIGRDQVLRTPFGPRLLEYFDWTASGRALRFVEEYLQNEILPEYANTHTEDAATGLITTLRLHAAERILKDAVHAGEEYRIVHCGSGTTEAIHRLMQILGIYVPPLLLKRCRESLLADREVPVVFIGPYEHHSNVVPWREGLCYLVEIEPAADGGIDPDSVEAALADPRWEGRPKIGCFSAASNVTGIRTNIHEIARRLHRHGALACFDWAAAAPYDDIDVRGKDGAWLDAVFFSPHKFAGGPGSSGVLIFHERIYRKDLPPSFGGGGTVDYVGPHDHDYLPDIEEREKPGTPGILQIFRAALAMQVRDRVGLDRIRAIEDRHLETVMGRWHEHPDIEVLGNQDPARRVGIISFNVRSGSRYLHPRFVTRLMSDLFGIQTRAGCSCAGPYGHRLLGIDEPTSERYRAAIGHGCHAIKPGWVRLNLHYTLTDEDVEYLLDCVDFVAEAGVRFLNFYECRLDTGAWVPIGWADPPVHFGVEAAMAHASQFEKFGVKATAKGPARGAPGQEGDSHTLEVGPAEHEARRRQWRGRALAEARARAAALSPVTEGVCLPGQLEPLSFFVALHLMDQGGAEVL